MRVLVTGGAGFIASHIVDRLIEENIDVSVVDNLYHGSEENINKKANFYKIDITNEEDLRLIFKKEKPDVVIHHAAQIDIQKSIKNTAFDAKNNIIGTINILQCIRDFGTKKIIYPSSAAVYGDPKYLPIDENHSINPISFYGLSKNTPEKYIKLFSELYGLKYTIFRYANVYGPRQDSKGEGGVIAIFTDKLIHGDTPIIYGNGEQTRDFVYVKDVAEANILAINKGDNEIINISTDSPITVNALYKIMQNKSNNEIRAEYKPKRKGDILHSYLNNDKAKRLLNWNYKYDINKGIKETIEYYKSLYADEEVAAGRM